ncbi:MAG TPA: hypothetical protein DDZ96_06535 [Porphyromonadaceae bacterium]|jgi:RNA binding exosome subunit|uniref:hypothetical protein n=1 Tax=Limibacterium fermenti TaxID=3229863 RepID=UPI000E92D76D|nr:hypothetical protein [Porphyromonadaceae bacterium]HBK32559.1 hypothetical protein [Porphyromonadaceae bacterium]HBL33462.1 hypothetical protein [Porphyromonadaceae bacterium]HBX20389.1 hypothetical protein [Porphyromonadaceae bacterium]HBX44522.1 hypothetical protein [Porphyromonadaceae bacterium]
MTIITLKIDKREKEAQALLEYLEKLSFVEIREIKEDNSSETNKEEFFARIDRSIEDVKRGRVIKQNPEESIDTFIDRLLCTE